MKAGLAKSAADVEKALLDIRTDGRRFAVAVAAVTVALLGAGATAGGAYVSWLNGHQSNAAALAQINARLDSFKVAQTPPQVIYLSPPPAQPTLKQETPR